MHPLLTRRRPERWSPRELRPLAWFDVSDVGSLDIQSGLVAAIRDRSGNGNHAVQATGANRPAYNLRGFNGKRPAATFNGSSQFMTHPAAVTAQPFAVCFVGHGMSPGTGAWLIYCNTDFSVQLSLESGNWKTWGGSDGIYTGSQDPDEALLYSHWNGTDAVVSITGTKYTYGGAGVGTGGITATMTIGAGNGGGNYAAMNLGELLVFPRVLNDADRQRLEGYVANKWGFNQRLPQSHPFRNSPP